MANAFQAHTFQADAFQTAAEIRVDTNLGTVSSNYEVLGSPGAGSNEMVGQSFTTVGAFQATGFSWLIFKTGTPADNVIFELVDTDIGTGTVLASKTVSATTFATTPGFYYLIDFDAPVDLAAATQYFLRVSRSGARDVANRVRVGVWITSASYSGGEVWVRTSGVWGAQATQDMRLAIYGVASSPVTLPFLVTAPYRPA